MSPQIEIARGKKGWTLQIAPYILSPELNVNLLTRKCFLLPYFIYMKSTVNATSS